MDTRHRHGLLIVVGLLAPHGVGSGQQPAAVDSLPPTVTSAMVAQGKKLFLGEGLCLACHGADGKGAVGPNLTDQAWLHGQGDYSEIVARILSGTGPADSKTGQIMPPKGGSALNDSQVRAVAAYVWSLSRPTTTKNR